MITATITAKGQITIPAEIRQALKLDTGDQIAFEEIAPGFYAFKPAQKVAVTVLKGMFGKPRKVVSIREMNSVIAKRAAAAALSGTKTKSPRTSWIAPVLFSLRCEHTAMAKLILRIV